MKNVRNLVGPQIRRVRSAQELTQDELAARLQRAGWDVSRVSVAKIEAQLRWVADCELYLIAHVLEVSMQDLFPPLKKVQSFLASPGSKRN